MNNILTPQPLKPDLTETEQKRLQELEIIVKRGINSYWEVGKALTEIRDRRLYREKYATFEKYCREVWDLSKTHVNRQIGAAQVVEVLTPIGVNIERESVVRPLVGLDNEQIKTAVKEAQKAAGDEPLTARLVAQAAAPYRSKETAKPAVMSTSAEIVKSAKPGIPLDFGPALKCLTKIERAAKASHGDSLLKELGILRKYLEALANAAKGGSQL